MSFLFLEILDMTSGGCKPNIDFVARMDCTKHQEVKSINNIVIFQYFLIV